MARVVAESVACAKGDGESLLAGLRLRSLVKSDAIRVAHSRTPKNIEGRADRQINTVLADARNLMEVFERLRPARVSSRNGCPSGKLRDKLVIDSTAEPLDIDGVNQKLRAKPRELLQRFL